MSQLGLACHNNFSVGRCPLELAQGLSGVALAWHDAGGSAPFGVTMSCDPLRKGVLILSTEAQAKFSFLPKVPLLKHVFLYLFKLVLLKPPSEQTYLASVGRRSSSSLS